MIARHPLARRPLLLSVVVHTRMSDQVAGVGLGPGVEKRENFRWLWCSQTPSTPQQSLGENRKKRRDDNFLTENVIQAIVVLEILRVIDLPKLNNSASPLPTPTPHKLGHGPLRSHLLRQKKSSAGA